VAQITLQNITDMYLTSASHITWQNFISYMNSCSTAHLEYDMIYLRALKS